MTITPKSRVLFENFIQDCLDEIRSLWGHKEESRRLNSRLGQLEVERGDLLDIVQSQADTLLALQAEVDQARAVHAMANVEPKNDLLVTEEWLDQVDQIRNLPEQKLA